MITFSPRHLRRQYSASWQTEKLGGGRWVALAVIGLFFGLGGVAGRSQTNAPTTVGAEDSYPLNLQDKLLFSIQEDPISSATPEELYVNAQSELHFRVSRGADEMLTINVRGKTLAQVKKELKAKLDADYYQSATIDLKLKEQTRRAGQVLFLGAVRGNVLPLAPGETKTIFEGVYQVGVNEYANLKKVKLNRVNSQTGKSETYVINLEAIKKGDRAQDMPLQDGDRIEVPEKSIVF